MNRSLLFTLLILGMANAFDYANLGLIHEDKDATFLNKLRWHHLYHHQYGYVDGADRNDRDFNDRAGEYRRAWMGVSGTVFKNVSFKATSQLSRDRNFSGGELEWGHQTFRNANLKFDLKGIFGLSNVDKLETGYGRRSMKLADEWQRSASHILAVERSDFSNKLWPNDGTSSHPVGTWLKWAIDDSTYDLGIFSGSSSAQIAGWQNSTVYFASYQHDFSELTGLDTATFWAAGYYQDADTGDQTLGGGNQWAGALVYRLANDKWGMGYTVGLGSNGNSTNPEREGLFGGAILMPTYWLEKDKWQLISRYQLQLAEASEGIRLNSRYARASEAEISGLDINGGYGDVHHNFYLGINYYIFGENLKIVSGIQYDDLSSDHETVYSGWTPSIGFRSFF